MFKGPIFIVGMPRSGTKLLRDLLKQHSWIAIPKVESHFIPLIIKKYKSPAEIKKNIKSFSRLFRSSSFVKNFENDMLMIDDLTNFQRIDFNNWSTFFESLLRPFLDKTEYKVWGDKTPGYLNHLSFLKEKFPQAKFIHIVRDPRDYALSVKRTWGKNIFYAAYKWRITMQKVHGDLDKMDGNDYLLVYYEEFISQPEAVLRKICYFIGITFQNSMLSLSMPTGSFDSAGKSLTIEETNRKKYKSAFNAEEIEKIERIVMPSWQYFDYKTDNFELNQIKLSMFEVMRYRILDTLKLYLFYIRTRGFVNGTSYFISISLENLLLKFR